MQIKVYAETLVAAHARQAAATLQKTLSVTPSSVAPSPKFAGEFESAQSKLQRQRAASVFHERVMSVIDPSLPRSVHRYRGWFCILLTLLVSFSIAQADLLTNALVPVGPVAIRVPISANADNAEEMPEFGNVRLTSLALELGYDRQKKKPNSVGLRFTNLDIPQGVKISSARIFFCYQRESRGGRVGLAIRCEQSTRPRAFGVVENDLPTRTTDAEESVR